ncbi:hypothetical protein EPN95_00225 [Patescibacteria group bacterium]|nr:MAG: hypothetical protein EPN95_00225 [Patescibacteria group bacterium]
MRIPKEPINRPDGERLVTVNWLKTKRERVAELRRTRAESQLADTSLIIPAAQHPLVGGILPNPEFEVRLAAALEEYKKTITAGGKAEFFLTGNRHHDSASGETDNVALYDAAGLWLMQHKVPAEALHGKDWLDLYNARQYNGAAEIKVAAKGFIDNPRFSDVTYVSSPGQRERATMYGLAYEIPLDVMVPPDLSANQQELFHSQGTLGLALNGFTRVLDPYGTSRLLTKMTADRIPPDGNVGTVPEQLSNYADLPWYATT